LLSLFSLTLAAMDPHFSFAVDRQRDLVRIVLTGLFMPEDVADFLKARRHAHAQLICAAGQHVTLTDLRAMKILPQETVVAFQALLANPTSRARRIAFVVAPTLVRSQLMRALAGRDSRCFLDPAEAEAWLFDEDEAVRRPASWREEEVGVVVPFRQRHG
jgi:hypothetical protein